jgi:HPt (histidine-containing phosphotransfer) domain-containing protein
MSTQENSPDLSLLDPEQLEMLSDTGTDDGPSLLLEILDLFEQESTQKFRELAEAVAAEDIEALGRDAHSIAGSSANIGGRELWRQAKDIENRCKTRERLDQIPRLVDELRQTYSKTLAALRSYAAQVR